MRTHFPRTLHQMRGEARCASETVIAGSPCDMACREDPNIQDHNTAKERIMASKETEFTSEAKSEVNAQVASAAKCPVDHGAIAASPVSKPSGPRTNRDWWPNHLRLELLHA